MYYPAPWKIWTSSGLLAATILGTTAYRTNTGPAPAALLNAVTYQAAASTPAPESMSPLDVPAEYEAYRATPAHRSGASTGERFTIRPIPIALLVTEAINDPWMPESDPEEQDPPTTNVAAEIISDPMPQYTVLSFGESAVPAYDIPIEGTAALTWTTADETGGEAGLTAAANDWMSSGSAIVNWRDVAVNATMDDTIALDIYNGAPSKALDGLILAARTEKDLVDLVDGESVPIESKLAMLGAVNNEGLRSDSYLPALAATGNYVGGRDSGAAYQQAVQNVYDLASMAASGRNPSNQAAAQAMALEQIAVMQQAQYQQGINQQAAAAQMAAQQAQMVALAQMQQEVLDRQLAAKAYSEAMPVSGGVPQQPPTNYNRYKYRGFGASATGFGGMSYKPDEY